MVLLILNLGTRQASGKDVTAALSLDENHSGH